MGALIAAAFLLAAKILKEGKIEKLQVREKVMSVAFASTIMVDLSLKYWSLALAPLVVVQPIFLIGEMVAPTLMGLFGFGERKQFDRAQWLYFGIGVIGAALVIFGFIYA